MGLGRITQGSKPEPPFRPLKLVPEASALEYAGLLVLSDATLAAKVVLPPRAKAVAIINARADRASLESDIKDCFELLVFMFETIRGFSWLTQGKPQPSESSAYFNSTLINSE
jgi:hypothetical protein